MSMTRDGFWGGIETGGTKTVVGVGRSGQLLRRRQFPTGSDPQTLFEQIAQFFAESQSDGYSVQGIGVATFGPCDPREDSALFGFVTTTPKPGWENTNVVGGLREAFSEADLDANVPMCFDTDVNAAALAELKLGAGRDLSDLVYFTIGTGIGAGVVEDSRLLHGMLHPELGHMLVPIPVQEDPGFLGVCPFHGLCAEGAAAGPALEKRWGIPGPQLSADHPAWDLEADYLASVFHNAVVTLSPQRIIVGGGVGLVPGLLERVRPRLLKSLAGYVESSRLFDIDSYLVRAAAGADAGVLGAILLNEV